MHQLFLKADTANALESIEANRTANRTADTTEDARCAFTLTGATPAYERYRVAAGCGRIRDRRRRTNDELLEEAATAGTCRRTRHAGERDAGRRRWRRTAQHAALGLHGRVARQV